MYVSRSIAKPIWSSYMNGQILSVGRASTWWACVGVVCMGLLSKEYGLSLCRGAFNLALLLAAPSAVDAAETYPIRSMLLITTLIRLVIWSLLIPASWFLLVCLFPMTNVFTATLVSLMFLDGVSVAYSNSVDIDCGGLDILAKTYHLPITDYLRYRYITLHQSIFDYSFVLFTPLVVAGIAWFGTRDYMLNFRYGEKGMLPMVGGISIVYAILACGTLYYYNKGLPKPQQIPRNAALAEPLTKPPGLTPTYPTGVSIYSTKCTEALDGLLIVLVNSSLRWRVICLSIETALEDVMVSVIVPMLSVHLTPIVFNDSNICLTLLLSCCLVAIGKLGGIVAYKLLNSQEDSDKQTIFNYVLISSLWLALLPIGFYIIARLNIQIMQYPDVQYTIGLALIATGIFCFFAFSGHPKQGFSNLIQTGVDCEENDASSVFGFVGIFVTLTDGLLIIAINLLFYNFGFKQFESALGIVAGLYIGHGIFEYLFGVMLLKLPDNPMPISV